MALRIWMIEVKTRRGKIISSILLLALVSSFLFIALSLMTVQFHNATFPLNSWESDLIIEDLVLLSTIEMWSQQPEVLDIYYMTAEYMYIELNKAGRTGGAVIGFIVPDLSWLSAFPYTAVLSDIDTYSVLDDNNTRAVITFYLAKELGLGIGDSGYVTVIGQSNEQYRLKFEVVAIENYSNLNSIYIESTAALDEWLDTQTIQTVEDERWATRVAAKLRNKDDAATIRDRWQQDLESSETIITATEFRQMVSDDWSMQLAVEARAEKQIQVLAILLVVLVFGIIFTFFILSQIRSIWVLYLLGIPLRSLQVMLAMEPFVLAVISGVAGTVLARWIIMNVLKVYVDPQILWQFSVSLLAILFVLAMFAGTVVLGYCLTRGQAEWIRKIGGN